ncbi:unnamed protein product [Lathyrus sativus]|nr:unnamed protein product [Lathyrus sativus]
MKLIFLAMFLLIISGAQAISNEDEDFNVNFTSENRSIIQTSEQVQNLLGNLYGNGNIDVSTRLVESNNEYKHELSVTKRKGGRGGGGRAGRGRGRGGGGRAGGRRGGGGGRAGGGSGRGRAVGGGAAAGVLGAGIIGGSNGYHGTHHSNNSATSLSAGPQVCVSIFILCLSFWR